MDTGPALRCPTCGSISTDPEFCSECGAAMTRTAQTPLALLPSGEPPPVAAPGGPESCPICGEARPSPSARYCDNCRYDFLAQQPFSATPPTSTSTSTTTPTPQPAPPPPPITPFTGLRFDLHATPDPTLRRPEDPSPPDLQTRIFPLDLADHLIGRRSDAADIHPEITLPDPGISRRHARILRAPGGELSLLDLASTNGTRLNGTPVAPNVATPLVRVPPRCPPDCPRSWIGRAACRPSPKQGWSLPRTRTKWNATTRSGN